MIKTTRIELIAIVLLCLCAIANAQVLGTMEIEHVPDNERGSWINQNPDRAILVVYSDIEKMTFQTNHGGIVDVDNPNRGIYHVWLMHGTHQMTYSAEGFRSVKDRIFIEGKGVGEVRVKVVSAGTDGRGDINIETVPSGCEVILDGNKLVEKTPIRLENQIAGNHQIRIENGDDYFPIDTIITVVTNSKITFSANLRLTYGNLIITSEPEVGMKIFLDGKYVGDTPMTINRLPLGYHKIELVHDLYLAKPAIYNNKGGDSLQKEIEVIENYGTLNINSTEGATVFLNDSALSDLQGLRLKPQVARLRAEKTKYRTIDTTLIIELNELETIDLFLEEGFGIIEISVDPPEAYIVLKGDAEERFTNARTKVFGCIPIGRYVLQVSAEGYETAKCNLQLKPDENLRKHFNLTKSPTPQKTIIDLIIDIVSSLIACFLFSPILFGAIYSLYCFIRVIMIFFE
ncbi:MAG: PEGA domain-containing protein [Candidatus Hatepunaea meridiana]|nr:PEGA domain-containing protein [Candidatus Hatepunaea meridiana]